MNHADNFRHTEDKNFACLKVLHHLLLCTWATACMKCINDILFRVWEFLLKVSAHPHHEEFVVEIYYCPQWVASPADNKIECCEIQSTTLHGPDKGKNVVPIVPKIQVKQSPQCHPQNSLNMIECCWRHGHRHCQNRDSPWHKQAERLQGSTMLPELRAPLCDAVSLVNNHKTNIATPSWLFEEYCKVAVTKAHFWGCQNDSLSLVFQVLLVR